MLPDAKHDLGSSKKNDGWTVKMLRPSHFVGILGTQGSHAWDSPSAPTSSWSMTFPCDVRTGTFHGKVSWSSANVFGHGPLFPKLGFQGSGVITWVVDKWVDESKDWVNWWLWGLRFPWWFLWLFSVLSWTSWFWSPYDCIIEVRYVMEIPVPTLLDVQYNAKEVFAIVGQFVTL